MQVFHLKSTDAAAQLNISQNTLKRLSKRLNVGRWPQRKLASLANLMAEADQDSDLSPKDCQASVLANLASRPSDHCTSVLHVSICRLPKARPPMHASTQALPCPPVTMLD